MVLLKVLNTWARPTAMFLRSRRLVRTTFFFFANSAPDLTAHGPQRPAYRHLPFFRRTPTVFRGPRLDLALVRVRWPLTGNPRRWRSPR